MRTRRSRFFVILLHVVGVSHSSLYLWNSGDPNSLNNNDISTNASSSTGHHHMVEPNSIALQYIDYYEELLQINARQNRSSFNSHSKWKFWKSFRRKTPKDRYDLIAATTTVPIWLQDPTDGLCLGPMSTFSECGDATLWFVTIQYDLPPLNKLELLSGIPTPSTTSNMDNAVDQNSTTSANVKRMLPSNTRIGLTFRVVDQDFEMSGITTTTTTRDQTRRRKRQQELSDAAECLDADPNNLSVHVGKCLCRGGYIWQRKRVRSSVWTVNTNGILQPFETRTTTKTKSNRNREKVNQRESQDNVSLCLTRNLTQAILANCENHDPIQFSFLRYHAVPTLTATSTASKHIDRRRHPLHGQEEQQRDYQQVQYEPNTSEGSFDISSAATDNTQLKADIPKGNSPTDPLLIQSERSHDPATIDPLMHPELKIASRLIFADQSNDQRKSNSNDKNTFKPSPFAVALSNTNPFLLANTNHKISKGPSSLSKNPSLMIYPTAAAIDDGTHLKVSKLRRMQTHPYLNEAKDGIWTDPQTNLRYQTDLCHYLGRNRPEHGRHTLTGFGIYRKGYVIKVYGIAYYVSKRDVLTDPALEPYATMTAEQLRSRPDFYEVLRTMRDSSSSSSKQKAGYFDRTIMLKTNMQLSTETMRSSLEADWSYLTDEAKRTLVDASMQEQVADDAMIEFIQSPDNPSRCSCSQVAPPEYKANPDCCARGTELVFTWTKANELEVRLNGRLMDIFPRPDIAEGIFYEYLRVDNPISPEFVDRVVDGFPFLLGPLAQIRGIHIGQSSPTKGTAGGNAVLGAMVGFRDFVMSETMAMSEVAKQSMLDTADHVGHMSKMMAETAMEMAKEADRRRDLLVKHTVAAPEVLMKLMARDEETVQYFVRWMSGQSEPEAVGDDHSNSDENIVLLKPRGPRGRTFGYPLSRWFGEDIHYSPDEIEPMMIHPTINRFILALVHLYLLLLFIVSFPGSYSTRTKIFHRRYRHHHREPSLDDSDSDTISDCDTNSNLTIIRVGTAKNTKIMRQDSALDDDNEDANDQLLRRYDESLRYPYLSTTTTAAAANQPPQCTTTTITRRNSSSRHSGGGMKQKSLSYFL